MCCISASPGENAHPSPDKDTQLVAANFRFSEENSSDPNWSAADPDRAAARVLADEYAALQTMPSIKIMELVDRCWRHHADGDRRQLAQALLGIPGTGGCGSPSHPGDPHPLRTRGDAVEGTDPGQDL